MSHFGACDWLYSDINEYSLLGIILNIPPDDLVRSGAWVATGVTHEIIIIIIAQLEISTELCIKYILHHIWYIYINSISISISTQDRSQSTKWLEIASSKHVLNYFENTSHAHANNKYAIYKIIHMMHSCIQTWSTIWLQ